MPALSRRIVLAVLAFSLAAWVAQLAAAIALEIAGERANGLLLVGVLSSGQLAILAVSWMRRPPARYGSQPALDPAVIALGEKIARKLGENERRQEWE